MTRRCAECMLNRVPISEAAIAKGWAELSARPGLAKCLLAAIEQGVEVSIEGTPMVQSSLERQRQNELGLERSHALVDCFFKHQNGSCEISITHAYVTADIEGLV